MRSGSWRMGVEPALALLIPAAAAIGLYALVLAEASEAGGAKDYIAAAENGKLFPEEKKLLEEAKTKLVLASASPSTKESSPNGTPSP